MAEARTLILLRRWNAGDGAALDDLLAEHLDWIRALVHGRLGAKLRQRVETQDLVQDALIRFLHTGPRLEIADGDHFRRLMGRIVENTIRDEHRHLHRQVRDLDVERQACDTVLRLDPPRQEEEQPIQQADQAEERAWVQLAVELLEPQDREVILLRDWSGLEFEDIAERLGIGFEAARKRYQRALPKLANKLLDLRRGQLRRALAEHA